MTLIKSISGIRGTIGGKVNDNLTPIDTVKYAAAYGMWLKKRYHKKNLSIILGRDARISGKMVSNLVSNTLNGLGIHVIDIGLSTTPTVEMAVILDKADGGVIITASHNPKQWNALKLLNNKGEFLNARDGLAILDTAQNNAYEFVEVEDLGSYTKKSGYIDKHIQEILKLDIVDTKAIQKAEFIAVVDAVNSTGGIAIPLLLKKLGVECVPLYCEPNGHFPHNPEPLKEHLTDISELVVKEKADIGIVVDPDVDRLALICEDGSMFGEEYTLVACADYVLSKTKGNTVSNLSSTKALQDITIKKGGNYSTSAVGEVNVVEEMKKTNAIIGGEGNGGVIYPRLHYGRDALVGVAIFLSHLAKSGEKMTKMKQKLPQYHMIKDKIELDKDVDFSGVVEKLKEKYKRYETNEIDGLKVNFEHGWAHLRKSNTEPILRLYIEHETLDGAHKIMEELKSIV